MYKAKERSGINKGAGVFWIFLRGIAIYIGNFLPLSRVMLFPVLGQVAGIALILGPVYFYRQYLVTIPPEVILKNAFLVMTSMVLIVVPGFMVFIKAFWDYMVAMVSLNTMVLDITKNDIFEDFKAHNTAINKRSKDYVLLLLLLTGLWAVLLFIVPIIFFLIGSVLGGNGRLFILSLPFCILSLFTISVWFSLSFQVFAFEQVTPIETLKKSFFLVKNQFWRAVALGVMVCILASVIVPSFVQSIAEMQPIMGILVVPFKSYVEVLAENPLLTSLPAGSVAQLDMAKEIMIGTVGSIVTAFVLPFGTACYTLLYLDLKKRKEV